jgi:hypothetical protein
MVSENDKMIYFPRTFNEQMGWIGAEIEQIIKHNERFHSKERIKEQGKSAYGEDGYTQLINRLFEIIKADPKNKALHREVIRAEEELKAFLYDDPGALSEKEILEYWNAYLCAYMAELEAHPMHYLLIKKMDDKSDDIIGIYNSLTSLKEAYVVAVQNIVKHEKVMINAFDEYAGSWHYNVKPGELWKI